MVRKTFFSFHYKNDVSRAMVVRNSWVTKDGHDAAGFVDSADFEEVQKKGDASIKKWIDEQLKGTSVTVVLIGSETNNRDYVKYELQQSFAKGNGLLGIYVNNIKDLSGKTSAKGSNHFGLIGKDSNGKDIYFSSDYPCYDWESDKGYQNLGKWIEDAAVKAGR